MSTPKKTESAKTKATRTGRHRSAKGPTAEFDLRAVVKPLLGPLRAGVREWLKEQLAGAEGVVRMPRTDAEIDTVMVSFLATFASVGKWLNDYTARRQRIAYITLQNHLLLVEIRDALHRLSPPPPPPPESAARARGRSKTTKKASVR